jgi:hypothetical protein
MIYQYSETNVRHILLNLLWIKDLYIFRALLAHLPKALHKRDLVYYVRVMSVGCYQGWSGTTRSIFCAAPPEDEQLMLETCRGP